VATLAIQTIDKDGVLPSYVAAAGGGDKVVPGQGTFIHVKNGGASPVTVTIITPETVDSDLSVQDRAVVVANASEQMIAIPGRYRGTDGLASVTYSAVTSVTIASLRGPTEP
jgi:hypothetical protein